MPLINKKCPLSANQLSVILPCSDNSKKNDDDSDNDNDFDNGADNDTGDYNDNSTKNQPFYLDAFENSF